MPFMGKKEMTFYIKALPFFRLECEDCGESYFLGDLKTASNTGNAGINAFFLAHREHSLKRIEVKPVAALDPSVHVDLSTPEKRLRWLNCTRLLLESLEQMQGDEQERLDSPDELDGDSPS